MIRRYAFASLIAAAAISNAAAQPSLSVVGTEFVLTGNDGQTHRGVDLVGATVRIGVGGKVVDLSIASATKDDAALGGPLFLYRFITKDAGNETDLCSPDAEGNSLGFPVSDGRGGFELACTSSAIGKCVRWGYRPWDEAPNGPPLRALHAACVHMVRADYGGDGHATTIDGMVVYVCDRFGVRPCAKKPPLAFEAAWGSNGATCVARPRVPKNASLNQLGRKYSKLKGHLGAKSCTAQSAFRDSKALLLNRSELK